MISYHKKEKVATHRETTIPGMSAAWRHVAALPAIVIHKKLTSQSGLLDPISNKLILHKAQERTKGS